MPIDMPATLKEDALDDYIRGYCPDVTELVPAPEIKCKCGYAGRVKFILSHLHEALCPECKTWVVYEEKD
jgi:hypothetical protein